MRTATLEPSRCCRRDWTLFQFNEAPPDHGGEAFGFTGLAGLRRSRLRGLWKSPPTGSRGLTARDS